jgi:hypothetical protein
VHGGPRGPGVAAPASASGSISLRDPLWHRAFAALQSDLENSLFSGQSIVSMIAQHIPPTLSLMILTLPISDRSPCFRSGAAAGQLDRPPGRRIQVVVGGATDAAQPSERMISR